LSYFNKSIYSVSEISSIYHFPFTTNTKTENIVKTYSKELPAPLSLKGQRELDVVFAKNNYGGSQTLIGLSEEEREKHMYIIGATGSGKTTMITSLVSQDIKNGKGLAVIDPHGDLAETLLTCIPDNRIDDLIYVNPDDLKYPIGINLLEITPGLDEDDLLREKEFITESVISLFRKVFSESMAGHAHRIEYILRNTIQTALTLENPTLFTIYELLNNPPFQKQATKNLEDENLKKLLEVRIRKSG
jgi:GTPase SAR1 family protein